MNTLRNHTPLNSLVPWIDHVQAEVAHDTNKYRKFNLPFN